MANDSALFAVLTKAYKSAHSEYLGRRSDAWMFFVLFGFSLAVLLIGIVFSERLTFKLFLEFNLFILITICLVGLSYLITNAIAATKRLECIKDVLEQAGYMIVKIVEYDVYSMGPGIKILERPPELLSDFRYFDADLMKALKSGKLSQKEISSVSYWVVPLGRINKYYVRLFS